MFVVDTWPYNVSGFLTFKRTQIEEVIEALQPLYHGDDDVLRMELAAPLNFWGPIKGDPMVSHIRWICHPDVEKTPKGLRGTGPDVFKLGSKAVYPKIVLQYRGRVDARRKKLGGNIRW